MSDSPAPRRRSLLRTLLARLLPLAMVLAVALSVLLIAALLPARRRDKPAVEPPPVDVRVMVVEPTGRVTDTVTLYGVLAPDRVVTVAAEVAGRVQEVVATEGRPVGAGSALVRLNDDLIRPERDRAAAMAAYFRKEYERMTESLAQGVATERDVQQAARDRDTALADLAAAEARLARTRIVSPIDGLLDRRLVELGRYVNVGEPVAEIVDIDPLNVVVQAPERDAPYFHVGQPAKVRLDPPFPPVLAGRIALIGQQADPATRTVPVEITVPNPPVPVEDARSRAGGPAGDGRVRELRSGPIARVELTRRRLRDAVVIPLRAVIPMEDHKIVYVVVDGIATPRRVQTLALQEGPGGLLRDWHVQVKGLSRGDRLIVDGHRYVAPGKPVRVREVDGTVAPATRPAAPATRSAP